MKFKIEIKWVPFFVSMVVVGLLFCLPSKGETTEDAATSQLAELVRNTLTESSQPATSQNKLVDSLMTNSPVANTLFNLVNAKLKEETMMLNFKFATVVHDITNQTVLKLGPIPGYSSQELAKIVNTTLLTAMAAKCSSPEAIQTWLNRYAGAENVGVGASGTMEFHPVMLTQVFRKLGDQTALPLGAYVEQNPGATSAKDMFTNLENLISWMDALRTLTPTPSAVDIGNIVDRMFGLTNPQVRSLPRLLNDAQRKYFSEHRTQMESHMDSLVALATKTSKEVSPDAKGWGGFVDFFLRPIVGLKKGALTDVLNDTADKKANESRVVTLAKMLKTDVFPELRDLKSAGPASSCPPLAVVGSVGN